MPIKTKKNPEYNGAGTLRVLAQDNDLNYEVQIEVMRSGLNQNKWDYRNVEQFYGTFRGQPILCAYVNGRVGDGHNMRETITVDGDRRYSFTGPDAERIVGMIYDTEDAVWTERRNGETWVIARGKLWRFYNPELVDKIAKQGRMEVSAETNVTLATEEEDREVFLQWYGIGVTILGDGVAPAVPGANIKALEAMRTAFKKMQLKAASYHRQSQMNNEGVKSTVNGMSNKVLLSETQKKFPDYRIIGLSENGDHVLMVNSGGIPCTYQSKEDDCGTVIPERISFTTLSSTYKFADGTEMEVDVMAMLSQATEDALNRANTAETKASNLESENTRLNEQIKAMNEAESARRVKAAKNAVEKALEEAKNLDMEVAEDAAKCVMDAVESGKYNTVCNEAGEWVGETRAVNDVMVQIGMLAMQKAKQAAQTKTNTQFSFEGLLNGKDGDTSGIEALIARNLN